MKFADIAGQKDIKKHLQTIVDNKKVSHAIMFSGPQGSGKFAMALAFAQYLNCENHTNGEPCGQCVNCKKIETFNHPDIVFVFPTINSKKNTRNYSINFIEQWQEMLKKTPYFNLQEWISYITKEQTNKQATIFKDDIIEINRRLSVKPFETTNRIIIIWQADKMNTIAANKILKILEEPQPNTYFILTTEHPDAILPTIISRTQIIKFPKVKTQDVVDWIKSKYPQLNEIQVINISRLADGNIIYAKQLAELFLNDETFEMLDLFKTIARNAYKNNFLEIGNIVNKISEMSSEQQKELITYMLRIIRVSYLINKSLPELTLITNDEKEFATKFSKFINDNNIDSFYKLLNKTYFDITRNANKKILWTNTILHIGSLLKIKQH